MRQQITSRKRSPVSLKSLLSKLLMLALTVVKSCEFDGDDLIVSVRPRKSRLCRCPHCGRKAPVHDVPSDPRRWRALDLGQTKVYLEYRLPRVKCGECGVHAAGVPWARPVSRFTRDFEDQVAWLADLCQDFGQKNARFMRPFPWSRRRAWSARRSPPSPTPGCGSQASSAGAACCISSRCSR